MCILQVLKFYPASVITGCGCSFTLCGAAAATQGSNTVQWHSFSNCSSNLTLAVPHNGWVLANVGALQQSVSAQPNDSCEG